MPDSATLEDDTKKPGLPDVIVSSDSHVLEPDAAWESMPAALRAKLPKNKPRDFSPDGGWDPKARIVDMDKDGLTAEVLYPTIGLGQFAFEKEVQEASFRSYNDWIADFCKHSPKRLFAVPCLAVYDIDLAIKELQRCNDMGLKGALIWQMPDPKLPLDSPHYERLWAAAAEMDAPINLHILTGHNYARDRSKLVGAERVRGSVNQKTADTVNTLFDMIWSGIFDRHPKLKLVLVESELGWLPLTLQQWDYYYKRFTKSGVAQQDFKINRLPSEIFDEHCYVTFMDDFSGTRSFGWWGDKNCMWSSDYPHGNMTWPNSLEIIAKHLDYLPRDKQERLLRDTVVDLYHLDI